MLGCGHKSPTGFMATHQKLSVCVCDNFSLLSKLLESLPYCWLPQQVDDCRHRCRCFWLQEAHRPDCACEPPAIRITHAKSHAGMHTDTKAWYILQWQSSKEGHREEDHTWLLQCHLNFHIYNISLGIYSAKVLTILQFFILGFHF